MSAVVSPSDHEDLIAGSCKSAVMDSSRRCRTQWHLHVTWHGTLALLLPSKLQLTHKQSDTWHLPISANKTVSWKVQWHPINCKTYAVLLACGLQLAAMCITISGAKLIFLSRVWGRITWYRAGNITTTYRVSKSRTFVSRCQITGCNSGTRLQAAKLCTREATAWVNCALWSESVS